MASDQQLLQSNNKTDSAGYARSNPGYQSEEPLPEQKTCTGYCVYKALSIVYAIFYVLIGLLLLGLGIWVLIIKQEYDHIIDIVSSPAVLCILVGLIVVLTALVGCIGAAINKLWPLRVFLGVVVIVFIIQVVIGILAYVYREEAIAVLEDPFKNSIKEYNKNDKVREALDNVQRSFDCCGFKAVKDWNDNTDYSCKAQGKFSCGAPDSCCKNITTNCGLGSRSNSVQMNQLLHMNGCASSFLGWIEEKLDVLGATALGLAIMHILGMFVVYMLITKIEDRIRLFKYRKRYYTS